MHESMKTITLDEVAYARLKVWKRSQKASFSHVVKRILPGAGTLGAFLNFVEANDTAHLPGNDVLDTSGNSRPAKKADPWS